MKVGTAFRNWRCVEANEFGEGSDHDSACRYGEARFQTLVSTRRKIKRRSE